MIENILLVWLLVLVALFGFSLVGAAIYYFLVMVKAWNTESLEQLSIEEELC